MLMLLKSIILSYWKSIIIISGILYLSFASPSTFKEVPSFKYEDKLVHLIMYAGLTCVLIIDYMGYSKNNRKSTTAFLLICLALPVLFGGMIEIAQPVFFAPRTAEWIDWFSDIFGVMLGWFGIRLIRPQWLKSLK